MITEISYLENGLLNLTCGNTKFVCSSRDYNCKHEGIWNSKVMAFVPHPKSNTFSDGVPVSAYEEGYSDYSGVYFDHCVVCEVATNGNRYCGASCEQHGNEEQGS